MLFAARSATALHRLLDVLPVFAGDDRIRRRFTLVPGSDFGLDALAAVERAGARTIPWDEARRRPHDLIVAASPKGRLDLLRGPRVLLPHGAGFGKSLVHEPGSPPRVSGLEPAYLAPGGRPLADLHALAHPSQVSRLAARSPATAARAAVVGDPTLDRILASRSHRDRYRAALRTGARRLVVLTSTWGPQSLFRRRPALPADLTLRLPHDAYQVALVLHPNERSREGDFDLTERLAPALDAGLVLSGPHEEWAALLVAADAVVTDHGSAALYAAALDRPVLAACDGGGELVPGSPMARLLDEAPRLEEPGGPDTLDAALAAHRPGSGRAVAATVFAEQGRALDLLRDGVYRILGLAPPRTPAVPRVLPAPTAFARTPPAPSAFAVRIRTADSPGNPGNPGAEVHVERFPPHASAPAHHLAAEHGTAGERHAQSAALLYRRAAPSAPAGPATAAHAAQPHSASWTAAGWTARILEHYPGCRTAAVVLSPSRCLLRTRRRGGDLLLTVRIDACRQDGRVLRADPAAVLSAVHARLGEQPDPAHDPPAVLRCVLAGRTHLVHLTPATPAEATHEL